ncbi:hypothetical protein I4U23_023210 [Adineta vaga]|nr:hypothetical protein I4U23_023210 [Adineta vaga]
MMSKYFSFFIFISLLFVSSSSDSILSEKELKLIRYLSYLTHLQTTSTTNITWNGWEKNYDGPQLGLDSIRYPLAHIGYTAAALAYRTPNYRELALNILNDTIKRMLTIQVWGYIDQYWKKTSTFPDPVYYENIMYSGHLLQLITLYESISGDFIYDTQGFDFIWNKDGQSVTKIHYTTTQLAYVIYRQMNEESSAGVSCEPGWVYTICQNHPHLGLKLYDIVRNSTTTFSQISSKWKDFLNHHALEDIPLYKKDRYFKMLYQRSTHIWVPFFAATGNDGWALAWMSSWYDQNQTSNFICNGWEVMYKNKYWIVSKNHSLSSCYLEAGGYIGVRMQMNRWIATSFYPIVEKQCSTTKTEKLTCAYSWFENDFGLLVDTDHDGYFESFYYETNTVYSNWVTTNVLLSLLMGENGDETREFLRKIYTTKFHEKFLNDEPEILAVQYPSVRVTRAQYDSNTKLLILNFNTEKPMILSTQFDLRYPYSFLTISNMTRDGTRDGFTSKQIANNRIRIEYSYNTLERQNTEFHILFH